MYLNEEPNKKAIVKGDDLLMIRVIENPITKEKSFLVENKRELYSNQVLIAKEIIIDGVLLVI